jgi:hypothetical protein
MSRNGRIEAEILKPLEQAAVTKVVLIQVPLLRASLLRRLPALAGAFIAAWAQAGPGNQVPGRGEIGERL